MLRERARAVAAGLRVMDGAVLGVSFAGAYGIRAGLEGLSGLYPPLWYGGLLAAGIVGWMVTASLTGVYGQYRTLALREECARLTRALGLLALFAGAAVFAVKGHEVSRLLVALWLALALLGLVASRVVVRAVARGLRRRGLDLRRFAVVGTGPLAREVAARLLERPEWGFELAGFVLESGDPASRLPGGVLGRVEGLGEICAKNVVDLVVFAVPRERLGALERAVSVCDDRGIAAKIAVDLFPARNARISVEELEGIPLLSLSSGPQEILPLLGKRAFDFVASAVGLFVLAPVLLATALAVKLDSKGPVFFRQERVGRSGRIFWLFKFRSMRTGAEAEAASLRALNEADGPVFKMRNDPRVTKVGRFIRRTSIDELPQLLNVLSGEMSLVGPRPPLPSEVEKYEPWQVRRLSVKPGITCTWQISGRSDVGFKKWVELDLEYIDGWSLWRDVGIVLRTIPAVLSGRGAR